MPMAAIYSSSPPTSIASPYSASSHCIPCSSSSCSSIDVEFQARALPFRHHPVSRPPVLGGLSSLFGSSPSLRCSANSTPDSTADGIPISRRSSHNDLCVLDASDDCSTALKFIKDAAPAMTALQGDRRPRTSTSVSRRSSFSDLCALLDGSDDRQSSVKSVSAPISVPQGQSNCFTHKVGSFSGSCSVPNNVMPFSSEQDADSWLDGNMRQADLNAGSSVATIMSPLDICRDASDIRPGAPRFSKLACSSLSEFFCKPLFPEAFRTAQDVLRNAQRQHEVFKDPLIITAFHKAEEAHYGQSRADGDPYLVHCVETAIALAEVGASKLVVAAGLLHDTLDDSSLDSEQLGELFGPEIQKLVEGVSKLSELSKLARDNGTAYNSVEADRLHTTFLAMTDSHVVLIKLADRLHNMRTLAALPSDKRYRIAKETIEVFVPLAARLGIWRWKAEMEDLCFKHLKPQEYQELAMKLSEGFREATILSAIQKLNDGLLAKGLHYHDLCGRTKNLHSIYKKMIKKGRRLDEIYDLQGLRLIVASVEDCYAAVETVHRIWPCVPGKFKDYIKQPKLNGYQSLHTVVWCEDGHPLEIQIRTMQMHHQAEYGVAAHWRYKEGNILHSSFVLQMVEWARWVLSWQNEIMDTKLRLSESQGEPRPLCLFPFHREDCQHTDLCQIGPPNSEDSPLFIIVLEEDKMMVQELPGCSTLADLLIKLDKKDSLNTTSDIGIARPKVNHEEVEDLHQRLKMGDLVEVTSSYTPGKSLSEFKEELNRLFNDCSIQDYRSKQKPSWRKVSEVVVI